MGAAKCKTLKTSLARIWSGSGADREQAAPETESLTVDRFAGLSGVPRLALWLYFASVVFAHFHPTGGVSVPGSVPAQRAKD